MSDSRAVPVSAISLLAEGKMWHDKALAAWSETGFEIHRDARDALISGESTDGRFVRRLGWSAIFSSAADAASAYDAAYAALLADEATIGRLTWKARAAARRAESIARLVNDAEAAANAANAAIRHEKVVVGEMRRNFDGFFEAVFDRADRVEKHPSPDEVFKNYVKPD